MTTSIDDRQVLRADTMNEGNSRRYLAEWTKENEEGTSPGSMRYRVECQSNNRVIRDWTEVVNPAATQILQISADDLAIIDRSKRIEMKIIRVETDYAGSNRKKSLIFQPIRYHGD